MRKTTAAAGSSVFFALAPGMVAGFIPWRLTRWRVRRPPPWWPVRALGAALIAAGGATMVHAFARFVREGSGTPAPVAPPERLVVGGLYRHVRNPMYLAGSATIVGQGLLLGQPILFLYAAAGSGAFTTFVRFYEEPVLARKFGADYETYRRAVPRWRPRLRPWSPGGDASLAGVPGK
jgi:protein-S-isoprenylcysteine O-methyltransferase Ste14